MTFAADLARFVEKTKADADKTVRAVCLEMGNSIIQMSPVDTGRFRGNWMHSTGRPHRGTIELEDPTGQVASANLAAALRPVKAGSIEFISNNLPYARKLEHGSSKQAPQGMVRVTATRFRALLQKAVRDK